MITVLAAMTGLCLLLAVLAPFYFGKGGVLAESSSFQSRERLIGLRDSLVERYIQEEGAVKNKDFSERTWKKRQEFLINRYVDATRRLDFLDGLAKSGGGSTGHTSAAHKGAGK